MEKWIIKLYSKIVVSCLLEKKPILIFLLFLVRAAFMDSRLTQIYNSENLESDHTSSEI